MVSDHPSSSRRKRDRHARAIQYGGVDSPHSTSGDTTSWSSARRASSSSGPGELELLRLEIETIWTVDARGRVNGPDLVLASAASGLAVAFGTAVPDDLATVSTEVVGGALPPRDPRSPPAVLGQCRELLEQIFAPAEVALACGPSYLVPDSVAFASEATLVRSDALDLSALREANPGNWEPDEWQDLLDGHLGPWAMALDAGQIVSICHTPVRTPRSAEAGTWTQPGYRGHGYAAATTAAWAALMRPTGRHLFYSTSDWNTSSQAVAARLSLRPIGWLWQLARRSGPILQGP
jgi:RimJ/RimL family protein N-acetyltransferase